MISVTSNQDFIDAWNSMIGTIDYVYLYLQGGKGVLHFKGESLSFSGKQSFSSLNPKKVKKGVYLVAKAELAAKAITWHGCLQS